MDERACVFLSSQAPIFLSSYPYLLPNNQQTILSSHLSDRGRGIEMAADCGSREERWSLAGTTALVTGGSKGIGHAIVEELAGFGARVHTCSRNAAELEECRRRWEEKNLRVTVSVCDVSTSAEREKLMETVRETFNGKLDILVNNVGQSFFKPTTECTAEEYSNVMTTNLESSFHLCQLAHPLLIHASIAGGGSIINMSSIGGSISFAGHTLYSITKGAMNQLTRSLTTEWAPDKIRVNGIAPGLVTTDMTKDIDTEHLKQEHSKIPVGTERQAGGDSLGSVISVYAGSFFHHRPGHLHRWWSNHQCLAITAAT